MLRHYFKVSLREMFKYRAQSAISIIGLAIGFTVFILSGYWLWWETHFDDFHPEGDRLYCLTTTGLVKKASGADADLDQLHVNDLAELRKLLPEIEQVCTFSNCFYTVKQDNSSKMLYGLVTDHSFFDLFRADFIVGSYKKTFPDGQSVILTERMALQTFGTTDCLNRVLELNGQTRPVVAGVIKNYPDNSDLMFQFLIINKVKPLPHVNRNKTYIRLRPNANADRVKEKLATYKSHADDPWGDEHVESWKINLRTPSEVHLLCHPELTDRIRNAHILALAGLMAFLSALMNLLVLFIGQQQRKQQKNRTYICIGASPKEMLLKGWTELLLPMAAAYLLAFCLLEVVYPYYEAYTAWNLYGIYEGVSRHIGQSWLVTNALLAIGISTGLFFLLSYLPIRRILWKPGSNPLFFKRGLIAGQIFIGSLFFLTSLILFRQLHFILTADKGLQYENVIQINMGFENAYENDIRVLKPELQNHPHVEAVCYTGANGNIFTEQGDWYGCMNTHLSFDPAEPDPSREDILMIVDKDFFSLFNLSLMEGTWIDESNPNAFIVNETGYRQLGYKDLTERAIYNMEDKSATNLRVCGIMKDYIYAPMQYPVQRTFFRLLTDEDVSGRLAPAQFFYVRYAPGHKQEVMDHVRQVTAKLNTSGASEAATFTGLNELVDRFNRPEKVIFSVFSIVAFICILISTFGIYSLVSLSAEQRRREIAIRKVNGATYYHILQLFFREYLILVILGNALALPAGYLVMQRWLETYANHIALTFCPFILVFIITCLIVFLSVFRQVKQAAETNPAEAVKAE